MVSSCQEGSSINPSKSSIYMTLVVRLATSMLVRHSTHYTGSEDWAYNLPGRVTRNLVIVSPIVMRHRTNGDQLFFRIDI